MREDMYENRWSPFDPKWYQLAFDKYISTADQLFNTDDIIQQGYYIPDADGSRSSVFRNSAVLNNSFNEKLLRETLKDIYLNTTHKLIASNHDNVHFFQWNGHMSDMSMIPSTSTCQFSIPTETFIGSKERDVYKLSQFYRKWIKVEDMLNNWDVFKWCCLLFINQKIYSEYELRMDDHETIIRFTYNDYWIKNDYPVYIYKFDTNASCRVLISRELCNNQWNWKVPVSYITDSRIINSSNIIVSFNKISDPNIRNDGLTHIDVLGDNLEFLKIEDGYIDLSNISRYNKQIIMSESTQYLWMSVIVPKFFHEYPIMLPTDAIYRPYEANFQPVVTIDHERVQYVKSEDTEQKQVYVDLNGELNKVHNGWAQLIRPIVLSDAYDGPYVEPYEKYLPELNNLIRLTVIGADIIENFRFFIKEYTSDREFNEWMDKLINIMHDIRNAFHALLDIRRIEYDQSYESLFKKCLTLMSDLKTSEGVESDWFHSYSSDEHDFWYLISPLIYIPREFADKFYVLNILSTIRLNGKAILWDDIENKMDQIRFRRPIEVQDFWTFEYDDKDEVWRPYPLELTHHFPDVYTLKDPSQEVPALNRVFKSFFFYSDTINVLEESDDIIRATPSWDNDMIEYMYDQQGIYRDIFMEKFYWMGIRSIYSGLLMSKSRWEVIEYIIDNDSYQRFNDLFLQTMDPYFKMGLATYLKSDNFEFPFDDAIAKMEESMSNEFIGHKKITNFEMYLNKTWIPSYFDYIVKILDNWDYGNRLVKRPRNSFDITRLLPMLLQIQNEIFEAVRNFNQDLDWLLERLNEEDYKLQVQNIIDLKDIIQKMYDNINEVLDLTNNLDLQIFSVDDINRIIDGLKKHIELIAEIGDRFAIIYSDINTHNVYELKRGYINDIVTKVELLPDHILKISANVQSFDMEAFMLAINDLRGYFEHDKYNPDDKSLIGYVNKFESPWSKKVKEYRNNLFISTTKMYSLFDKKKTYSDDEVFEFMEVVDSVKKDIDNLRDTVSEFWETMGYEKDQIVINHLDNVEEFIDTFTLNITEYLDKRNEFISIVNEIKDILDNMNDDIIGETEFKFKKGIINRLDSIITALSHIVGVNKKDEALKELDSVKRYISLWIQFISIEEEVFLKLYELFEPPVKFLDVINLHHEILNAINAYMNTVNYPYIADPAWPTYSDIYEVDEIEINNGGLLHSVGDNVFAPGLGSFVITEVDTDVSICSKVADLKYRNTTYRDPMVQANPYDSITSGNGLGIMIKPIHSTHRVIINDDVIISIEERIKSALQEISDSIESFNPHTNVAYQSTLDDIKSIKSSWDNIIDLYIDYMSNDVSKSMDNIINILNNVIDPSNTFIEERSNINLDKLIQLMDNLINESSKYTKSIEVDENYSYYEYKIIEAYTNLSDFNGNGTQWSDSTSLKEILVNITYPINIFNDKVISNFPDGEDRDRIFEIYTNITDQIDLCLKTLRDLPNMKTDVIQITNIVKEKLNQLPDRQRDIWYRIKKVAVALEGKDYKIGDIVEIIPQLPLDTDGNEIHDQEELIMNDIILLQVSEVDEYGRVISMRPFMNYAIPYKIWGIRETKTRTGSGSGLTVDVFSYQLELSDSTIFNDQNYEESKLPPFDENDMFVFRFENIHDLNMNYEVFLGGKQIRNYYFRHEDSSDPLHPGKIDIVYINANDVMNLQNSSVYIPADHYFIYKLDKLSVNDPGAGYCIGQDIYVATDKVTLNLQVTKLTDDPYKGIAEVTLGKSDLMYERYDPSTDNASVITDSLNNIDDEYNVGYYDQLTSDGIIKPASRMFDADNFTFKSMRFDELQDGDRNKTYMYPDVDIKDSEGNYTNGDPDSHFYLGSRIDNSQHPMEDSRRWNGIMNIIPPTHPFIPDNRRIPTGLPIKGEYQEFASQRFHNSVDETNEAVTLKYDCSIKNAAMIEGDLIVPDFAHLPKNTDDFPDGKIGSKIIVECDENNDGHRMLYRIRTFVAAGFFVYDLPEIADYKWNSITIDWMNCDFYPDYPCDKAQYPSAPWSTAKTYRIIQENITDDKYVKEYVPQLINTTSYIDKLTVDDLSVFNWTTKQWEDLHDESRWELRVYNGEDNNDNPVKYGFSLILLEEGSHSYNMTLYWNKVPDNQIRNALLKRNATIDVSAIITGEVNTPAINTSVNTGRHLRIRKLFPYEQREEFRIGKLEGMSAPVYEMNVRLANYIHFKNELHLEDVKVYNKSAGRFENILDPKLYEVQFRDPKAISRGYETNTEILQCLIADAGEDFVNGEAWAYNKDFGISVFGYIKADFNTDGHLISFEPIYCPNPPDEDISIELDVYQNNKQSDVQKGVIMIEFHTERREVYGDGYIHKVTNKLAPLPREFKLIIQYDLDEPADYEVIISKTPKEWTFVEPKWLVCPTFHLDDYSIQQDRLYILTDKGRLPLINPSTGKPSLYANENEYGTDVQFLNLYRRFEHIEIRSTPYPMRSVYTRRHIPKSGYIDLTGKLNKPLNKKYFEFWVNGKLMYDEVTIISPTKLFLHGLKSLKNLEILEINRDSNEFFSDNFMEIKQTDLGRPFVEWDYQTYLDDALAGTLEGDNYTTEEQEYLLSPVWKQVESSHPEYKNYPPNIDIEEDVLLRVNENDSINGVLDNPVYQFMIIDPPTLEGHGIVDRSMKFEHFGFRPITDTQIIDMLNEEWEEEIKNNPVLQEHSIISDEEWYGTTAKLYDEFGVLVHTLNESAYHVADTNILQININSHLNRIVKNPIIYDLD